MYQLICTDLWLILKLEESVPYLSFPGFCFGSFFFSGSMNPNTPFALSFRCRSHAAGEKFEMCHSKL